MMGKLSVQTTTTTSTKTVLALAGAELIEALKPTIEKLGHSVEDVERIYVQIPGGGDWSNTRLDIDSTCPLIIELKRETKE